MNYCVWKYEECGKWERHYLMSNHDHYKCLGWVHIMYATDGTRYHFNARMPKKHKQRISNFSDSLEEAKDKLYNFYKDEFVLTDNRLIHMF